MEMINFILLSFCFLGVISSVLILSAKNPVQSVFYLILVFCISSCILLFLTVDFIAIIFIVVYVGAIAVLFLFIVMMLNVKLSEITESYLRYLPIGISVLIIFFWEINYFKYTKIEGFKVKYAWVKYVEESKHLTLISNLIYLDYFYVFLLSGMILLLAMLGTISLTLHHSEKVKRQTVYNQVSRSVKKAVKLT